MIVVSRGIFDKIETVLLRETRNKDGNVRMEIMKSKMYIINRFNSEEKFWKILMILGDLCSFLEQNLKNLSRYYRENSKLVTTKLAEHRVGITISI